MAMQRRILLAEDDPHDVELIRQGLRVAGIAPADVDVAPDGQAALDKLLACVAALDSLPVLVVLDLKMPRMNGLDVLSEMRAVEALAKIPVVMLTSSREASDVETAYRLGANAYVVKPVAFRDFIETVQVVARFWANLNEPPPPRIPG
jgi:CheY-like chemotaxis protein